MIDIRELKTIKEMEEVQVLERHVWNTEVTPTHQTFTAVKNGGMMIGAFTDGRLIGYSYAFPGFKGGEPYLCSHMLGVHKDYRSRGIGEMLKRKQREIALLKGYDRILWTFDPLEARNAYLNLNKLHGICDTYIENCYGEMKDELNKGLPSDRFELHWFINSPHVRERKNLNFTNSISLNSLDFNHLGIPIFVESGVSTFRKESYSLLIPRNFQDIKRKDPELAMDWRLKTRGAFLNIFQAGYAAIHLQLFDTHATYMFVKKDLLELGGE